MGQNNRTMKKLPFCLTLAILGFVSCKKSDTIFIYSPDRSQCITHISNNDIQYVIDGKHTSLPYKNYVVLDVSSKDLYIDNSLNVCWRAENESYEWQIVIDDSTILKSTLDTARFSFKTELPKEDGWIPTEAKFRNPNCATIDLSIRKSRPPSTTIIKEK
jgi:hypothetical protein